MKKIMKKDNSYKYVKVGFSWSTYFFGWIPSIYRGDFKSFFKIFILGILTLGVYTDVKSFTVNKNYEYYLIKLGYREFGYIEEGIGANSRIETMAVIAKILFRILCLLCLYIFIVGVIGALAVNQMHQQY